MSDYDFKTLNDKEFEILCTDLLSVNKGRKFERFKVGKDGGVDGRFFADSGREVVLQCKHWPDADIKRLAKKLSTEERPKIAKLNPERYILAVSKPLSRNDKKALKQALSPYLKSEADIFGKEDLNDILKANSDIERRHYKLWLSSSEVLDHIMHSAIFGRSEASFDEIREQAPKYVVTSNHNSALEQLEKLGAVIITGEPGVGKTTLADHLCLHYVVNGYEYFKIGDDLAEAEGIFRRDKNQIFYFDDFLGRNYLEALKGHEGTRIVQFFRRITSNKANKRFVLTSRSTILNQGKLLIDSFEHQNLQRNEYELQIRSLSNLDKAHILYNHIWHSGLQQDYIEQLYVEKRYRHIVAHFNFNPRLISYITDSTRLDKVQPNEYWEYVLNSLKNPAHIWDNPFEVQQDDFGKAIVFLVVINGRSILERQLAEAYARFIALPENQSMHGRRGFHSNIKTLVGSLLNRTVLHSEHVRIDLFNPSIGDYVLNRYSGDVASIRQAMLALYTVSSLRTLASLVKNGVFTNQQQLKICEAILRKVDEEDFISTDTAYLSELCEIILSVAPDEREKGSTDVLKGAIHALVQKGKGEPLASTYNAICHAHAQGLVTPISALELVESTVHLLLNDNEISAVTSLLEALPSSTAKLAEVKENVKNHVVELARDNLEEFVDVIEAFQEADYQEYDKAEQCLTRLVECKFGDLGIDVTLWEVEEVIRAFNVASEFDRYWEKRYDDYGDEYGGEVRSLGIDEIDDLFDRG